MAQGVLGDSEGWGFPVGPRCYDQHLGLNLAKYLGVITGEDKTLSAKAISDRIAKVHAQLDM